MRIIFVADAFIEDQVLGGGELNNHELMNLLVEAGQEVMKINSQFLTVEMIEENKDAGYIISNFINMTGRAMDCLTKKAKYVIYEHDHKNLKSRNPATYESNLAPAEEIINRHFYSKALGVFCQSGRHAEVAEKNLKLDNIISVGGNLWPVEILNLISSLTDNKKDKRYSIMNSPIEHKNTRDALLYCKAKELDYDLIDPCKYEDFIARLSKNDTLVLFPKTLETLCRVVVEARMLGCKIITNDNVSATSEDWFSLKGHDLIKVMKEKRETIPKMVLAKFM